MNNTSRSLPFFALIFAATCFANLTQAPAATDAASCAANPANRALDFWLGQWTIAAPGGAANATSTITLQLDKCLVVERWDGGRGHTGEKNLSQSANHTKRAGFFFHNKEW